MNTKDRIRIQMALKEDTNIIFMAGVIASSLILMNPLPVLIGMVAEVAYLLYIPDSRWYTTRVSSRFDATIKNRRASLQKELFPLLPDSIRQEHEELDTLRAELTHLPIPKDAPHWPELLRQTDYLMEVLLDLSVAQVKIPTGHSNTEMTESENTLNASPIISERQDLLTYHEEQVEHLTNIAATQEDATKRNKIKEVVGELERSTNTIQMEIFQLVSGQHLSENINEIRQDVQCLIRKIPERVQENPGSAERLYTFLVESTERAERIGHRLQEWQKQQTTLTHRN